MKIRENYLRALLFQGPEYIPVVYSILPPNYFLTDPEELFYIRERHPALFPGFVRPASTEAYLERMRAALPPESADAGGRYVDDFGCVWTGAKGGFNGTVSGHPLADWDDFKNYRLPDPERSMGLEPIDWEEERRRMAKRKAEGHLTNGCLRHGHTFLQLTDLCGYENLTYLMADEEPELETLIARLEEFNCTIIQKYLDMDVDLISIPEDLGMQTGPMVSPTNFRKYILPSYQRMIGMVRTAGKPVHMHSDGDIRTLANDIIEAGCQALNLQDLVNGIDWIAENVKGRVCIDLDVDRQNVTVFGSPKDVDDLIREEVEKLNTPAGGLMLTYGYYAGTPVENADAVATALEKYALHL